VTSPLVERPIGPEKSAFVELECAPMKPTVVLLFDRSPAPVSRWTAAEIDRGVLDAAVARAWYWPEARPAIARATHALRFEPSQEAPTAIDLALLVTHEAAAHASSAIGVLWESTGLVHDPASFVDQAADASREDPPLYLWVRFEGTSADDGTLGMRTTGLTALGAMEVEAEGSTRDGEHVLECVTDVALFLLTTDRAPDDGETIDVTRGTLRVRRMPSLRGDGTVALRVRV
jgi:hypothetical protein